MIGALVKRYWLQLLVVALIGVLAFGIVAHSFAGKVITGPHVHTVFKTDGIGKEAAWWKHK